jgi:serine/threonine protein kinase
LEKFPDIPGYILEKNLGRGRCTDVYLAMKEDGGQRVVIKVLLPELVQDETFGKRFLYEMRKAAKLEHENIARILDVGETPEHFYFVIECFLESLRSKLINRKRSSGAELAVESHTLGSAETNETEEIDPHEILNTLRQLLDAIDYSHEEEAVHRDLRPENIFFREDGTPVIADFYMSRIVAASDVLKQKGVTVHKPHYASPEQVLKKSVDISSDIYSLGITLYEMLTGKVPFDADTTIAIENQHIMESIPLLPEHLSPFQPLVDAMMAKTLDERAKSGAELILLMEEVSENLVEPKTGEQVELHIEEHAAEQTQVQIGEPPLEQVLDQAPVQVDVGSPQEDLVDLDIGGPTGDAFEAELKKGIDQLPHQPPEEPPAKKSLMLEVEEPPKRAQLLENLPEILRNPKILIAGGAAVVIIVLAIIFILPSGETETTEKKETTAAESQQALTPEQQQEQDVLYTRKFRNAQRDFRRGNYERAMEQITEAEKIKTTKELQELKAQIETKMVGSKDDKAFQEASAANTITAYQGYLDNFASGAHAREAQNKIAELKKLEKKREQEKKKWAASRIKLRSEYKTLTVKETRAMTVKYGFFEKYYNKNGDFRNYYETLTNNGVTVILDNATGLIWHQSGSTDYMGYKEAGEWLARLNSQKFAGYSDWRLPTLEEALSLLEKTENQAGLFIDSIFSKEQKYIWTGDIFDKYKVWAVDLFGGDANHVQLTLEAFVRPVRSQK